MATVFDKQQITELARLLNSDQLVLFAGAGISYLSHNRKFPRKKMPLWKDLAINVAEACDAKLENYNDSLFDLFDGIVTSKGRSTLEEAVRSTIPEDDYDPTEIHKVIARLPWHIIYTTNYDNILARALENPDGIISSESEYDWLSRKQEKPKLIHIHGVRRNLITLTGQDFALWHEKNPRAFSQLSNIALNKTILFVGYSFSDPNLNLHLLPWVQKIRGERNNRNYAWMWQPKDEQIKLFDRRNMITVTPINKDREWLDAFEQLEEAALRMRKSTSRMRRASAGSLAEAGTSDSAIINGYKLFYYRHSKGFTHVQISKLTGIEVRKLRRLEVVSKTRKPTAKCFAKCRYEEISRIEDALESRGALECGNGDDFAAKYILYYDVHRSRLGTRNYQKGLPFPVTTKAVVFDFGGTLTKPEHLQNTWERLWLSVGYTTDDAGLLHKQYSDKKIKHQEWCDRTAQKLRAAKFSRKNLMEVANSIHPIDGLLETLRDLKSKGVALYIVSGNIRDIIVHVLGDAYPLIEEIKSNNMIFEQDGLLKEIKGHDFDFDGKADYLRGIMAALKCPPIDVLFVGNSLNDSWASQSGARTLCVNPSETDYSNTLLWNDYLRPMNDLRQILPFAGVAKHS